jgi:acetylornithine deacetylase/succinyl-diaminopimelate desuccinylase-like protein
MRQTTLLLLFLVGMPPAVAELPEIDWAQVERESLEHFAALLRIDTSSPPGNETEAARYLRGVLADNGISSELFSREDHRANLVARIEGNGSRRPILVLGHTDVVGAEPGRWTVDPFQAASNNGYIYGRGALDDKDNVTAGLMLLLLLERHSVALERDVVFLAEAGEEGTPEYGVQFMIDNHWDRIAAEYCIAEGGTTVASDGSVDYVAVATTEKFPMRVRLVARGTAGHGSIPRIDNAVTALATAVSRLGRWQPPMRLIDTTETYFERLATISSTDEAERYRALLDEDRRADAEQYLAEHEPQHYSLLRTSVVPTVVDGGFRMNVIPSEAEAVLDIRALPGEDPDAFYEEIAALVDDPNVEIIPFPIYRPPGPPSSIDNEMFRAFESATARMFPSAVTLPSMLTGATDMSNLRAKGVQCYGIGPIRDVADIAAGGGAHGDDERILEGSLIKLVQFLWYAVGEVAAVDQ